MDRFSTETASLAGNPAAHFRFFGELPQAETAIPDLKCCDCREYFSEVIDVPGYGACCASCAPAAIAFMAAPVEMEAVPAQFGSACCGASVSYRQYSYGVDAETGYHDDGEVAICQECGNETEMELVPVAPRKPVVRAQAELFQMEVA